MFALVVSGRPVITDAQTISPTQCAFNIPARPAFSYIVVFILPGQQLPPDMAAGVYAQLPPSTDFKLLGALGSGKPSAIFRVQDNTGVNAGQSVSTDDMMVDDATLQPSSNGGDGAMGGDGQVVIGISVEAVSNIEEQLSSLKAARQGSTGQEVVRRNAIAMATPSIPPTPMATTPIPQTIAALPAPPDRVSTQILAQRIIENAFNYLSSFAEGTPGREVVPLKRFQDWWDKFKKRLEMDASFLEKADMG